MNLLQVFGDSPGGSPAEDHKDSKGPGASAVWGKAEWEKKIEGEPD